MSDMLMYLVHNDMCVHGLNGTIPDTQRHWPLTYLHVSTCRATLPGSHYEHNSIHLNQNIRSVVCISQWRPGFSTRALNL